MRAIIVVLTASVLGSCVLARDDQIRDRSMAIRIARAECGDDAPTDWHADLSGDYWWVWSGGNTYDDALHEIMIAKRDGKTPGCGFAIR